ncbi:BppU family phage baseplate upper protein [Enterococcus diestrammenae]|uniref:BppU family phage baseplate upper protein n=1 Tax=Enterococcus diestrammenae TaxID=1155073 RepID=UPI003BF6ADDE
MAIRYPITLSTTEPNNDVGLLKIRQTDQDTQTFIVTITENSSPKAYTGLKPFFCAKISTDLGLGLIEQEVDGPIDSANGKLEYTLKPTDWQNLGRHTAYFSFRRMNSDGSFSEQFTTRDFYYNVIKSVYSDGITEVKTNGSTYLWTFEDLKRRLDEYLSAGKSDWDEFVNQNKEILESLDPNGELLNQLNDLKTQLDEAKNNNSANINDEIMGGIRDIFDAPLFDIRNQLESRKSNVNIGHITDVHYVVRSDYWGPFPAASYGLTHLLNIGTISDKLDLIISGGDNADENKNTKTEILKHQRDYVTTLDTCSECPIIIGIGNHDDQSIRADANKVPGTDFLVTNAEFAELYFQKSSRFGEVRNGESNYCYYDIPNTNVRVIWLDLYQSPETLDKNGILKYPRTNTTVIQQDQLEWLANTALKTNRDVITFSHCNIKGTIGGEPTANVYNHDVLLQLINGFAGKTSGALLGSSADLPVNLDFNFSGQTGDVIAVVCGHQHRDDYLLQSGINYVITAQSVGRDNDGTQYWYTPQEDSWSVFSIDESTKTVEILKFGRGTGLTFGYGGEN